MAKFRSWRCPDCASIFRHLHTTEDDPPPDRCPQCGSWVADRPPEPAFMPQAPMIKKSAYATSVDQSYRAMEDASIARADEAASYLELAYRQENRENPHQGDPRLLHELQRQQIDEMKSGLKITNMADPTSMREGDTAVMPDGSVAAAAQRLSAGGRSPGFSGGMAAIDGYSPASTERAGAGAQTAITGHSGWLNGTPSSPNPAHNARAAQMIAAGRMGAYTGKD